MYNHIRVTATALAAMAALSGSVAQAGTATYTISGSLNGSFAGKPFTQQKFTFTMAGLTSNIVSFPQGNFSVEKLNPITSTTVTLAGLGTFTVLIPTGISAETSGGEAAFDEYEPAQRNVFLWIPGAPLDLKHSFGPIALNSFAETTGDVIPTSGGNLQFDIFGGNTTLTFTGQVIEDGVPEPSTWAMLALGFAGIGSVLRFSSRRGSRGTARQVLA